MNTNDNTEPCPTCSMAVNKSTIKLAARVAELEAEALPSNEDLLLMRRNTIEECAKALETEKALWINEEKRDALDYAAEVVRGLAVPTGGTP